MRNVLRVSYLIVLLAIHEDASLASNQWLGSDPADLATINRLTQNIPSASRTGTKKYTIDQYLAIIHILHIRTSGHAPNTRDSTSMITFTHSTDYEVLYIVYHTAWTSFSPPVCFGILTNNATTIPAILANPVANQKEAR